MKRADDRNAVITEIHDKVPTTSASSGVDNCIALVLEIAKLAAKRKKRAAAFAAVPARKPADPRRPKSFTGEGDQDQAGAVRRFTNALSLYLGLLSEVASEQWCAYAMLFLEDTAVVVMVIAEPIMRMPDVTTSSHVGQLLH